MLLLIVCAILKEGQYTYTSIRKPFIMSEPLEDSSGKLKLEIDVETRHVDAEQFVIDLVQAVKSNRELLDQARIEIRNSRTSISSRKAWKDFIRKHFTFSKS